MDIQFKTYEICKLITKVPARARVQTLMRKLNHSDVSQQSQPDNTILGYQARKYCAQFYGYLLVDQERSQFAAGAFPLIIPPLIKEDRILLLNMHQHIVNINKRCVKILVDQHPDCAAAIDPYGRHIPLNASSVDSEVLFSSEIIEELACVFECHPAIAIAQKAFASPTARLTSQGTEQGVQQIVQLIEQSRIFDVSKKLQDFLFNEPMQSPARVAFRYFTALASLRTSLHAMDQMLYQSFLQNHIFTLGSDNVIEVNRESHDLIGGELEILFQPDNALLVLRPADIVLVTKIPEHISQNLLCQVNTLNNQFSRDFGLTNKAELRVLDDNLNPYGAILSRI